MRKFTSSNATVRCSCRRLRSMHGRRTIGASPACTASQATAIERLSTSSTERSLSTPTFSRSYAGLSFTHFHNAFHLNVRESEREIALAFETAGQALMADPSDPAAHCAVGRAQWLAH